MLIEFLHIRSLIFLAVGSKGLPVPTCQLGVRTTLHSSLEPLMVVQHVFSSSRLTMNSSAAWNSNYKIEKAGIGLMTARKAGEGLACRFIGPCGGLYADAGPERFEGAYQGCGFDLRRLAT